MLQKILCKSECPTMGRSVSSALLVCSVVLEMLCYRYVCLLHSAVMELLISKNTQNEIWPLSMLLLRCTCKLEPLRVTAGVAKHTLYLQKGRCPLENTVSGCGWLGTDALNCSFVQMAITNSIFYPFALYCFFCAVSLLLLNMP